MARSQNSDNSEAIEGTEATAPATGEAAAATPTENKTDERYVFVKHDKTGEQVKRKDFILECWTVRKMARGAIAKLLSELQGKKVPYQIVFAATKKVPGGPDKVEAAEGEAAPAEANGADQGQPAA